MSDQDVASSAAAMHALSDAERDRLVQSVRAVVLARDNRVDVRDLDGAFAAHHGRSFAAFAFPCAVPLWCFVEAHLERHFALQASMHEGGGTVVTCRSFTPAAPAPLQNAGVGASSWTATVKAPPLPSSQPRRPAAYFGASSSASAAAAAATPDPATGNPMHRRTPCAFYLRGHCKLGSACTYRHDPAVLLKSPNSAAAAAAAAAASPSSNKTTTVFVGGLSPDTREADVHAFLSPFGEIVTLRVPLHFSTRVPRGMAFVEFVHAHDAQRAVQELHQTELKGRTVSVKISTSTTTPVGRGAPDHHHSAPHADVLSASPAAAAAPAAAPQFPSAPISSHLSSRRSSFSAGGTADYNDDNQVLLLLHHILTQHPSEGRLPSQVGAELINAGCERFKRTDETLRSFVDKHSVHFKFVPGVHANFPMLTWVGPAPPPNNSANSIPSSSSLTVAPLPAAAPTSGSWRRVEAGAPGASAVPAAAASAVSFSASNAATAAAASSSSSSSSSNAARASGGNRVDASMLQLSRMTPAHQMHVLDTLRTLILQSGHDRLSTTDIGQLLRKQKALGWEELLGMDVKLRSYVCRHVPEFFSVHDVAGERDLLVSVVRLADGSSLPVARVLSLSEGSPLRNGMPFQMQQCKRTPCPYGNTCNYKHSSSAVATQNESSLAAASAAEEQRWVAKKKFDENHSAVPLEPLRVSKSPSHAAESHRLRLVLMRAIHRMHGGVLPLAHLQAYFDRVAHTADFSEVQHGLAQFVRLHDDIFVLSPDQARVSLTAAAVHELSVRDAEDALYEYELRPPPEVAMDATLPAYAEWYHIHGPGSEGKPRQPRKPSSSNDVPSVHGASPPAAAAGASSIPAGSNRSEHYPPGSLSAASLPQIESALATQLQRAPGHCLTLTQLASFLGPAMHPICFTDRFGNFGKFLKSKQNVFAVSADKVKPIVWLAGHEPSAQSALVSQQLDSLQLNSQSPGGHAHARSNSSESAASIASSAAAAAAAAIASSSAVVPVVRSVLVMVDGVPKGIRLRVESVAVLQQELLLAMEDRDLSPLVSGSSFTAAAEPDADGLRPQLTDEQLWTTMEDGARIYVLPPPPPKPVLVLMPPDYGAVKPLQCAADELADLPASLGQQLEASSGSRLYDEHVNFSETKPTVAAPTPPFLTAEAFRKLPAASVVYAVFDWCVAPLSVQTLLRGGVELDLQSACVLPTCGGRLLGHHAHLKPT